MGKHLKADLIIVLLGSLIVGTQLEGEWQSVVERDQGLTPITKAGSNNYSRDAKLVREDFSNYFYQVLVKCHGSGLPHIPLRMLSILISRITAFLFSCSFFL